MKPVLHAHGQGTLLKNKGAQIYSKHEVRKLIFHNTLAKKKKKPSAFKEPFSGHENVRGGILCNFVGQLENNRA